MSVIGDWFVKHRTLVLHTEAVISRGRGGSLVAVRRRIEVQLGQMLLSQRLQEQEKEIDEANMMKG